MIGYKDMTFCNARCGNTSCPRKLTEEVWDAADRINLPVAVFDFSEGCIEYIPIKQEE